MQLSDMEKQFDAHLEKFIPKGGCLPRPLALKAAHCRRVATEARDMSSELDWPAHEQHLAQTAGLLHDIGRFSQYAEFGTFWDAASVDHGERGAAMLREARWLADWDSEDLNAVLIAVRYHNRLGVPATVRDEHLALLRLVRDADKLDILRLVLDAVERDGFRDLPTMLPHVRMEGLVSPAVIDQVSRGECASLNNVRSLADFLLMQLSWVYDLNYPPAFRRLHDRSVVPRIMNQVDGDRRIHALGEDITHFVLNRSSVAQKPADHEGS